MSSRLAEDAWVTVNQVSDCHVVVLQVVLLIPVSGSPSSSLCSVGCNRCAVRDAPLRSRVPRHQSPKYSFVDTPPTTAILHPPLFFALATTMAMRLASLWRTSSGLQRRFFSTADSKIRNIGISAHIDRFVLPMKERISDPPAHPNDSVAKRP